MSMKYPTKAHEKYHRFLQLIEEQLLLGQNPEIEVTVANLQEYGLSYQNGLQCAGFLEKLKIVKAIINTGDRSHSITGKLRYPTASEILQKFSDYKSLEKIPISITMKNREAFMRHKKAVESKSSELEGITLIHYQDGYICPTWAQSKTECYLLRNRNGRKSGRQKIFEIMRNNKRNFISSEKLVALTGHPNPKALSKEIATFFESMATKFGIDHGQLYESNSNGYRLTCNTVKSEENMPF